MRSRLVSLCVCLSALVLLCRAAATVTLNTTSDLSAEIAAVTADTVVILSAGTYELDAPLRLALAGAAGARIVIQGVGNSSNEGTQLVARTAGTPILELSATYVTLRDLALVNGSLLVAHPTEALEVANVVFHNASLHAPSCVGLVVRACEFTASTALELGCADNASTCTVLDAIVQANYFHPLPGEVMVRGVVAHEYTHNTTIEENVFHTILTAVHLTSPADTPATRSRVRGNYFVGASTAAIAFGSAVELSNNLIENASVALLAVDAGVRDVLVTHNTVGRDSATCLDLTSTESTPLDATVRVVNNAFFCDRIYNLGTNFSEGLAQFVTNAVPALDTTPPPNHSDVVVGAITEHFPHADPPRITSYYPLGTSALIGCATPADLDLPDFACLDTVPPIVNATCGCYQYRGEGTALQSLAGTTAKRCGLALTPTSPASAPEISTQSPSAPPASSPPSAHVCAGNGACGALQLCDATRGGSCSACPPGLSDHQGVGCAGEVNPDDHHTNSQNVKPFVYCWDTSTAGRWIAIFAYSNALVSTQPIPRGGHFNALYEGENVMMPRVEQTVFRPGTQIAFVAAAATTSTTLRWELDGWAVTLQRNTNATVKCFTTQSATLTFNLTAPLAASAQCLQEQYARFTTSTTQSSVSAARFSISQLSGNLVRLDVAPPSMLGEPSAHELLAWLAAYNGHGLLRAAEQCNLQVAVGAGGRAVDLPAPASAAFAEAVSTFTTPSSVSSSPVEFELWWLGPIIGGVVGIALIVLIVLGVRKYQRDHRSQF